MTNTKQNAPTRGRGACEWNLGRFTRNRSAAAARLAPLPCGCRDPWISACRRPTMTAESILASVVHLNGHGTWTLEELRNAWTVATTDQERTAILKAHERGRA